MTAKTTADWVAALEVAAVPCGPINKIDEVFADPQVKARGLQISLTRPDGTETPGVANPIRLSGTPIEYEKAPPALGEGTRDTLSSILGLSELEISKLKADGAIG
jgi:crotonobetainyl-CoA:carnitine CoA-transferase CaiB-like acyl-CoA transferase